MSYEQAVVNLQETNAELVKAVNRVRDAAMGMNRMYASTSAGVAAVQDGEYFVVPGGGVYQRLYQRSSGSATLIAEYPDASAIGEAALRDVTTSPTDTTAGRLLKFGDFGVGGSIAIQPTLLADVTTPGDYWIATNSPADKPTARFCHLYVRADSLGGSIHQIVQARDTVGENFHRISDDGGATWSAWERIHTTANQIELGTTPESARAAIDALRVGDSGLGTKVAPAVSDLNAFFSSGYYGVSSSATNKPSSGGGNLYVHSREESDFVSQIFHPLNENTLWVRNHVGYLGGWQPWQLMYNQQNILGTVSQSGGVPTGAIIERGSNANGHYTKFADGTLICTATVSFDVSGKTEFTQDFDYPFAGVDMQSSSFSPTVSLLPSVIATSAGMSVQTRSTSWRLVYSGNSASNQSAVGLFAIGKWY